MKKRRWTRGRRRRPLGNTRRFQIEREAEPQRAEVRGSWTEPTEPEPAADWAHRPGLVLNVSRDLLRHLHHFIFITDASCLLLNIQHHFPFL
ncbi:unnamed protein product [Pleuronectes platessa]|uniref:Uncharacterized protein n=1 Tax=Pleuronectes platessa TaxID=8262 RepID=A0A9N7TWR4_PLEPL|nr:unnamed protein product [Pleuronectes platessa]